MTISARSAGERFFASNGTMHHANKFSRAHKGGGSADRAIVENRSRQTSGRSGFILKTAVKMIAEYAENAKDAEVSSSDEGSRFDLAHAWAGFFRFLFSAFSASSAHFAVFHGADLDGSFAHDQSAFRRERKPHGSVAARDVESFDELQREQDSHPRFGIGNVERQFVQRDAAFFQKPSEKFRGRAGRCRNRSRARARPRRRGRCRA